MNFVPDKAEGTQDVPYFDDVTGMCRHHYGRWWRQKQKLTK